MFILYYLMIFISGLYVFCFMRKHLLLVLLSLEYMVLGLFFFIFFFFSIYSYMSFFLVIYLIFSVCEGALGLSILVSMIRSSGSDYVYSSYLFLC
uniref:NADH-ubiquinone oxidoreductase chain 4L n=1 Tax=Eucriotettix oculatus TaxID=470944 RepID=A0A6G6BK68_9ORTH|nr:NADH dehydrogenase subunit 4L [Eucriotettix oculatus]QPK42095.1 NADH dehydrogenase subunit 4L [Eucriotettix oculatus]